MGPMPISRKQAKHLVNRVSNRTVKGFWRMPSRTITTLRVALKEPPVPNGIERPEKERNTGADYDTEWARSYPARFVRVLALNGVMRPVVDLFATPTIVGTDRLADVDGGVIFAANHHSHADTPLMMTSIPEPWRNRLFIGAAADYWFTNRITSPLSALIIGAIPVERHKVSRRAIDQSLELLRDGWSMLIFPEGARSSDGYARPFTSGAAFLSSHANVPVVPVYIQGTSDVLPKGRSFPRPAPCFVVFGAPMTVAEGEDSKSFAARIQQAVAELADETTTDWWQARTRAARDATPSIEGPALGAWRRRWAQDEKRRPTKRTWPEI